ncbi:hypothetical protein ACFWJY_01910 [Streptomyces anulatus]|uniref:hypothetical protein n=1 Tax=Streptomyces anulatus TaxID=1892 RepID=UPI003661FA2C
MQRRQPGRCGQPCAPAEGYRGPASVVVLLGDAVRSDYYRPITHCVLNRACLSQ